MPIKKWFMAKPKVFRFEYIFYMSFSLSAISCYQCSNKASLDECQESQVTIDCPLPVHHCAKMKYKSTTKEGNVQTTYHKGCVTEEQCNETRGEIVDCCSDDLCNTGYTIIYIYIYNI